MFEPQQRDGSESIRQIPVPDARCSNVSLQVRKKLFGTKSRIMKRGFNFPAHRNLRVSEGVENLLR
jgi:hypothetical protein